MDNLDTNKQNSSPAFKLYKIIMAGLVLALTILAAGFILNILKSENPVVLENFKENTFKPEYFFEIIKNPAISKLSLINYTGIFILILVPVTGLVYTLAYYIGKRKLKYILVIAGIIIILASSTVIGFLK